MQQEGQGGGVHTARQGQQYPPIAHLGAHVGHGLVDEGGGGPVGLTAADVVDEIADQGHTAAGVHHLGMELHAVEAPLVVSNGRFRGVVGVGQARKAIRQALHRIAMAHPHRGARFHVGEQVDRVVHVQWRLAVFGATGGHHRPAQLLHHQLHAVANPQHRNAQPPDGRITHRRPGLVHGIGAAAEDDALGRQGRQLLGAGGVSHHQGEHLGFPHPPGDQLGILGTEIQDHDRRVPARLGGGVYLGRQVDLGRQGGGGCDLGHQQR